MTGSLSQHGARHTLLRLRVWALGCVPLLLVPGVSAFSLAGLARLFGYLPFSASAGDLLCRLLAGMPYSVDPLWFLTLGFMACVPLGVVMPPSDLGATLILAYGSRKSAWARRLAHLLAFTFVAAVALVLGCVLWAVVLGGSPSLAAPHSALAVWADGAQQNGLPPDEGSTADAVLCFLACVLLGVLALVSATFLLATLAGLPVAIVALLAYLVLVATVAHPWLPGSWLMATRSPLFGGEGLGVAPLMAELLLVMLVSGAAGAHVFSRMDLRSNRLRLRGGTHA